MKVPTRARAMMFVANGKDKKTAKKKEQQQTSKKTRKESRSSVTKMCIAEALTTESHKPKIAEQKDEETHNASRSNTSRKHGKHKQQE